MIEVEAKFLVSDISALEQALHRFPGSETVTEYQQRDEYFNHPCRDFGATDEAFRFRTCNGRLEVTYKGPRLDSVTKTREELELAIGSADAEASECTMRSILLALSFRPAGCVMKCRRSALVNFEGAPVTVSIDNVSGLATYVELEIRCEAAEREEATRTILRLAETLMLKHSERRSYLELLGLR